MSWPSRPRFGNDRRCRTDRRCGAAQRVLRAFALAHLTDRLAKRRYIGRESASEPVAFGEFFPPPRSAVASLTAPASHPPDRQVAIQSAVWPYPVASSAYALSRRACRCRWRESSPIRYASAGTARRTTCSTAAVQRIRANRDCIQFIDHPPILTVSHPFVMGSGPPPVSTTSSPARAAAK